MALSSELSYSVRLHVIAKYLGLVLLVSVGVVAVPLIFSLVWEDFAQSISLAVIAVLFLTLGLLSLKIPKPRSLQSNEAYVIIAFSFIIGSLAMVYPMMQSGLTFIDALFESTSGITTTGLTITQPQTSYSKTFFLIRSWMQWYGGLGFIIFSLGLAFQPGGISKTFVKEVMYKDDKIENSKIFAQRVLFIYSVITVIAILVLYVIGLPLREAFIFTFSSISTGGFSIFPDSLASFSYVTQSFIIFFSLLGAISFPLFWIKSRAEVCGLIKDVQLRTLLICCALFSLLLMFLYASNWLDFWPKAILNAISLQTTTGFSTFDLTQLNNSSKFMLIASMFIGGSTISTAGGLKLLRLLIIWRGIRFLFFKTTLSSYVSQSYEWKSTEIGACLCLFALYIVMIFASTLVFVIMGYDPLDSLFDVTSAMGTVGTSSGVTGTELPSLLKGILCVDMLLGRLEIVTLIVILYPKTFIGRRMLE